MRADRERRLIAGEPIEQRRAGCLGKTARQEHDVDAQRFKPTVQIACVLLGQKLCRRHERDLESVLDQDGCDGRGDGGLARADIALQQAQHRHTACNIAIDFLDHTLLRVSQFESESVEEARA